MTTLPPLLLDQTALLLERILGSGAPADRSLEQYFRTTPALTSRERSLMGDGIYAYLRHRRLVEALHPSASLQHRLATLLDGPIAEEQTAALPPAIRYSLPDWLWDALTRTVSGPEEAALLAQALLQPAGVDLRVNTLRLGRDEALVRMLAEGFEVTPTLFSPHGLRLARRISTGSLGLLREGSVEVQEEGSQLISLLLAPQPGETVVDLCAGSGGKSLHLAALMEGQGQLIAADTDGRRLERLKPRAWRAGVKIIHLLSIRHERDRRLAPWIHRADRVLVDAPCSGSGTLRRNPEVKWRLTPMQVENLHQRQCALLAAGATLVRPGGWLVYATCSLLPRENGEVVAQFLAETPTFRLVGAGPVLAWRKVGVPPGCERYLSLLPHRSGTDGFFAALMQRVK